MLSIINSFLPLLVRLVGMMLDSSDASVQTQQNFLSFVESASKDFTNSAHLKASYDAQKERMDKMESQADAKQKNT